MRYLVFRALLGLFFYDMLLTIGKFYRLHTRVQNWPVAKCHVSPGAVERITDAVTTACTWYPKHAMCLQRSAVTTCMLRNAGVYARLVMGAQRLPFQAHAWVEVDGKVVNDKPEVCQRYEVLDVC